MGYFQVRYDSRVVIYERKMFIRLATDLAKFYHFGEIFKISRVDFQNFEITWAAFCCWSKFHSCCKWSNNLSREYYLTEGKYHCTDDLLILFGFSCFAYVELATDLLVWSYPNLSNRRSAVQ